MFSKINKIAAAAVLLVACVAFSGPLTVPGYDAGMTVDFVQALAFDIDTFKAASVDTVLDNFIPKANYDYVLSVGAFSGNGADSTAVGVYVDALSSSGGLQCPVLVDSIKDSAGAQVILGFGYKVTADKYRVRLKKITGGGTNLVAPDSCWIYIRKRVVLTGETR